MTQAAPSTAILVLGGTGKTGRRVATQLATRGNVVRAAARTPGAPSPGIVPTRFDWDDSTTYDAALRGVGALYLIPPTRRHDHAPLVRQLTERARAAGVRRIVALSVRGADQDPTGPYFQVEQAVTGSGAAWTILRPTWFAQNFSEDMFLPGILERGEIVAPTGEGRVPFVDADDIAEVAVAALLDEGHAGQVYELSGPRALSFGDAASLIGAAVGRPVRFVDVPPDAWEAGLTRAGLPIEYAAFLRSIMGFVRDGLEQHLSDGVPRALGRPARRFEDVVAAAAAAHVWRSPLSQVTQQGR